MRVVPHWIDGGPQSSVRPDTKYGEIYDPATGEVTASVPLADANQVDTAVQSAQVAWHAWRDSTLSARSRFLFEYRELLNAQKADIAELITSEHGKVLDDALGEVVRGLEVLEFACGIPHLLKGRYSNSVSTGVDIHSTREPLGVVSVISPFNFPAMVPMWFVPIAIACGNSVVLKPSDKDPSSSLRLAELATEAGLPDGVFNVVQGDSAAVNALLTHELVRSVSFVGSTNVARHVYETASANGKRVQALGGAKNHMVVLDDADIQAAAAAAVSAGFGSAGERCMAISVIVAIDSVADSLVGEIARRMAELKVGDGRSACDMGPLVTREHRDRVASYIDAGVSEGAALVVDGRTVKPQGSATGFWLGPTLFDRVSVEMSLYKDEIFGPLLSVVRVADLDEALAVVNGHRYGNGTAIFTSSGAAARRFEREVEVGMVGVNVPIPVPMAYYSFGGWKDSLLGAAHAHGEEGVSFFTRGKVTTSRWLDDRPTEMNLSFPQNK